MRHLSGKRVTKAGKPPRASTRGKLPHARRAVKNALTQQLTDMTTTVQVQPRGTMLSTTTMRLWALKIHNTQEAFQNLGVSPLSSPCNSVHDYTSCSVLGTSSGGSYNQ